MEDAGDPEIQHADVQPDAALVEQEDVVGLDVAVDDVTLVGVDQCQEQLGRQLQAGPQRQWPLRRQLLAQRLPLQKLHDQKRPVSRVDAEVVDDNDVRIGQLTGDAGLALEAVVEFVVRPQLGVDELDRDPAAEGEVRGLVHLRHAAAAAE